MSYLLETFKGLVGRAAGRIILLGFNVYVARVLGPGDYSVFAITWLAVRILRRPGTIGLDQATIRFSHEGSCYRGVSSEQATVTAGIGLSSASALLLAVGLFGLWLSLGQAADGRLATSLLFTSVSILPACVLTVGAAASRRHGKVAHAVLTEDVLQPVLMVLAFVLGSVAGLSAVEASLVSVPGSFVVPGIISVWTNRSAIIKSPRLALDVTCQSLGPLLRFGGLVALSGTATVLSLQIDRFAITIMAGQEAAGAYLAVAQLTSVFALLIGSFNLVLEPHVSSTWERGSRESAVEVGRVYQGSLEWSLLLSGPVAAAFLVVPSSVINVIFGSEFVGAASVLRLLTVGYVFSLGVGSVGVVHNMVGYERGWATLAVVALVINTGINVLLIPIWAGVGAAIGTVVAMFTLYGGGFLTVRALVSEGINTRRLWRGYSFFGLCVGTGWLVATLIPRGAGAASWMDPLVVGACVGSAGLVALPWFRVLRREGEWAPWLIRS